MTAVRWVVEHRLDQIGGPDWVEYPTEADAQAHAGTAGTVRALVTPEYVRVVEAAVAWYAACDPYAIPAPDVRRPAVALAVALHVATVDATEESV